MEAAWLLIDSAAVGSLRDMVVEVPAVVNLKSRAGRPPQHHMKLRVSGAPMSSEFPPPGSFSMLPL
jgi:hypothetical protein